eukprot:819405_1
MTLNEVSAQLRELDDQLTKLGEQEEWWTRRSVTVDPNNENDLRAVQEALDLIEERQKQKRTKREELQQTQQRLQVEESWEAFRGLQQVGNAPIYTPAVQEALKLLRAVETAEGEWRPLQPEYDAASAIDRMPERAPLKEAQEKVKHARFLLQAKVRSENL